MLPAWANALIFLGLCYWCYHSRYYKGGGQ